MSFLKSTPGAAFGLALVLALGVLLMQPQGTLAKAPEAPPAPEFEIATFALG